MSSSQKIQMIFMILDLVVVNSDTLKFSKSILVQIPQPIICEFIIRYYIMYIYLSRVTTKTTNCLV